MQNYYLKAKTALVLVNSLPFLRAVDESGKKSWCYYSPDHALDIIGTHDGGYCVNLMCSQMIAQKIPEGLQLVEVPKTPLRTWF